MTKPIDRLSIQLYSARSITPLEAQFALMASLGYTDGRAVGRPVQRSRDAEAAPRCPRHDRTERPCRARPAAFRCGRHGAGLCKSLGIETIFAPAPPPGEREGGEKEWRGIGRQLERDRQGRDRRGTSLRLAQSSLGIWPSTGSGKTYLECLFEEAPDLVWQADLAWIVRGGGDPVAEIKKHAQRLVACHIKDLAPSGDNAPTRTAGPIPATASWTGRRSARR